MLLFKSNFKQASHAASPSPHSVNFKYVYKNKPFLYKISFLISLRGIPANGGTSHLTGLINIISELASYLSSGVLLKSLYNIYTSLD